MGTPPLQLPRPQQDAPATRQWPEVQEEQREAPVDVFLRIRPRSAREAGEACCVHSRGRRACVDDPKGLRDLFFDFEGVIDSGGDGGEGGQQQVFEAVGLPAARSALEGFYTCILSLGQTGTGKTYTVVGTPEEPGLVPRILEELLRGARRSCRLSCLELHMDRARDLLAEDSGDRPLLEIRCIPERGVHVAGLSEVHVESPQAALRLISAASRSRSVARTSMNATSSRGHAVFQLTLDTGARLCVVDLAGRENERTTGCRGQSLAELAYINTSLFHLTNVIQALARPGGQGRVPFRNSKLTLLLSECLRSARTYLLATVSPMVSHMEDTLVTMRLAQAVRQISTRSRRLAQPRPRSPGVASASTAASGSAGRPSSGRSAAGSSSSSGRSRSAEPEGAAPAPTSSPWAPRTALRQETGETATALRSLHARLGVDGLVKGGAGTMPGLGQEPSGSAAGALAVAAAALALVEPDAPGLLGPSTALRAPQPQAAPTHPLSGRAPEPTGVPMPFAAPGGGPRAAAPAGPGAGAPGAAARAPGA